MLKLALHLLRIIGRVLFQAFNVGAFVVRRAGDQTRVNPVMDHVVFIYVITVVLLGQRVKEAAVGCSKVHVSFVGNNGSHTHIPILFGQINMLLRIRTNTSHIFTEPEYFRNGIHKNSPFRTSVFFKCADTAVCTGQTDIAAQYCCGIFHRYQGKFLFYLFRVHLFFDAGQVLVVCVFGQIGVHIGVNGTALCICKLLFQFRIPGKLIFNRLLIVGSIRHHVLIFRILGQIRFRTGKALKFTG